MDLQTAAQMTGPSGQLARIGTIVCFVVACGLLLASHAGAAGAKPSSLIQGQAVSTTAR